jgi:hypothetical protein
MSEYSTEQEAFWAGRFGDDYTERNQGGHLIANNLALFARVLARTTQVCSVIEFGASIGLNLVAIRRLLPEARLSARGNQREGSRGTAQSARIDRAPSLNAAIHA